MWGLSRGLRPPGGGGRGSDPGRVVAPEQRINAFRYVNASILTYASTHQRPPMRF